VKQRLSKPQPIETIESLIHAFRKKGRSLDPDLAKLHRTLKRHYLDTKLTTKQSQARASWDVEQTRRVMQPNRLD
jgi:hypothetical protein